MKTVVITGSARGLGFNMARFFREYNYNVVISDLKEDNLIKAKEELEKIEGKGSISYQVCDVSKYQDIKKLVEFSISQYQKIDIVSLSLFILILFKISALCFSFVIFLLAKT